MKKHCIRYYYPVPNKPGSVSFMVYGKLIDFTSSKTRYFRFKATAMMFKWVYAGWYKIIARRAIKTHYRAFYSVVSTYSIDNIDLGLEYGDNLRWRSYHLNSSGNNIEELIENATIREVDQDGEDLNCYGLDYGTHACTFANDYIHDFVKKEYKKKFLDVVS